MSTDGEVAAAARAYVAARRVFLTARERTGPRLTLDRAYLALSELIGPACAGCEDGLSIEADGICALCGRRGACPACAEDDCRHLHAADPA